MTHRKNSINLPAELDNDEQAGVLYSPFRGKNVNPSSWNRKMNFWKTALEQTAQDSHLITFDINNLPLLFSRKGLTPKCLPTVVDELQRTGKIKPLEDYKKSKGWVSWGFATLVKEPLSWGVSQIFGSPKKLQTVFVWPAVLEVVSEEVLLLGQSKIRQRVISSVLSYCKFEELCSDTISDKDQFDLVVHHLQSGKKIHVEKTEQHGLLVKICAREKTSVEPLTATDIQIFELDAARRNIENEFDTLSNKMEEMTRKAREHVQNKKRGMALHCLRQKKKLDRTFQAKSMALHNLEEIFNKIDEAETNRIVVQACEAGLAALKKMNQEVDADRVQSVMGDVQEAMEDVEEVTAAIHNVGVSSNEDALLEDELAALLSEDQGKQTGGKESLLTDELLPDISGLSLSDSDFPLVPTHSPSSSKDKLLEEHGQQLCKGVSS